MHDQFSDVLVECRLCHEVLNVQVHAVTPVVARVGGNIDALGVGIGQAQFLVDGQPVLDGEDAEHAGRGEMARDDVAGQPAGQRVGCLVAPVEHGGIVFLRALPVLVPPLAQGGHVVAADGAFKNREEIKSVPKIGAKAYEQAAGFLRVPESTNPFDKTPIHPESYDSAEEILKYLGFTKEDLGSNDLIRKVNSSDHEKISEELNIPQTTVEDILKAFVAPSRDPRDEFPQPILKSNLLTLEDLKPGMKLEGTVRNITDFGAFVDVGIHESGLVHISKMSKRRIAHPSEIMKVGDIISVWVIEADINRKRLALTMIEPSQE